MTALNAAWTFAAGLLLIAAAGGPLTVHAQPPSGLRTLPLRGNVFVLTGGGSNVTASVGKDGVLLVDAGSAAMADRLRAAVLDLSRMITARPMPATSCVGVVHGCSWWASSQLLSTVAAPPVPRPIVGIVNTADDPDHIGGTAVLAAAGAAYGVRNASTGSSVTAAWTVAHENAALRLAKDDAPLFITESYFGRQKKLNHVNGEAVTVVHQPAAHTDGDSVVHFRGSDVLAVGDLIDMTRYPVIDLARGGSIAGMIDALNWILDVAVVEHMMEGGTLIVPGHGRVMDAADVAYYRDMVTIVRDRVREMSNRGMTLDQITAARPTLDYDGRFGRSPSWTPGMFVEAIYRSLKREP